MPRKSAIIRLQVILLIDLIVVASAAAGYFYVSTLPAPALSSSQIQLMELQVTPASVLVGQPVKVSVNVTNISGGAGSYVANLILDGAQNQAQTVTFFASQTKTVDFTITGASEGTHLVGIGDLLGSFTLVGKVAVTNLAANRTEAQIGEPIGITAQISNNAQDTESYSFTLTVNDTSLQTKTGQLDAGGSANVLFEVSEQALGTYIFKVGGLTGNFSVTSAAQPAKPAEFTFSNLEIDPAVTQPGQAVTVSAQITNVGEISGATTVDFTVNSQTQGSKTLQLLGGETQTITFTVTENTKGTYNLAIGNSTGILTIQDPGKIDLTNFAISSNEVWGDQPMTISAKASNVGASPSSLEMQLTVDNAVTQSQTVRLAPGTFVTISFGMNAPTLLAGDSSSHTIGVNGLTATFTVVKTGYHTLSVDVLPSGDAQFTVTLPSGTVEQHVTPYSALLPVGSYIVTMPATDPTGKISFQKWNDGSASLSRGVNLQAKAVLVATFVGGSSCPSLYMWNGTADNYVTDVSNHGWLGYINYMNNDGSLTYYRNNPWDYVPLDASQLKATNGYYNLTLLQRFNEVFYTDQAYMMVVDHPANVNVYSTMEEQYLDPNYMGNIYTIGNPQTPLSAVDQNGNNVLPQISKVDGVFTQGVNGLLSPAWNNITWGSITLNLGNLTGAKQIKLVVTAIVNWGSPDDYNNWLNQFFDAQSKGLVPNGTQITPPSYMQVKDANGNWVRIPDSREFPLPPDGAPRTYVIDLTGLFPTNNYSLRINNFWNVTYEYIGVDTTQQQPITIQKINPQGYLYQAYPAEVGSPTGAFTKYGNVTPLLLSEDDMFVIGRQGDALSLQFPLSSIAPLAPGMVRDYFLYEASWFKDATGNWGFGFGFTVDPLPFQNMSGFPYQPTESYPNDTAHQAYLAQWNTRVYADPSNTQNTISTQSSFAIVALPAAAFAATMIYANYKFGAFNIRFHKSKREIKHVFSA